MKLFFRPAAICKALLFTFALVVLSGCISHEGVSLGSAPLGAEELLRSVESEKASDETQPTQGASGRKLILIGTVSSLRPLTNERSSARFYARYAAFVDRMRPGTQPAVSLAQFRSTFGGWTKLKSFTLPLVMGMYRDVLGPASLVDQIYFPEAVIVFMVQEAGDLLAARTNSDGFFVVDAQLCKNGAGYYRCAESYKKGLYDAKTGERLEPGTLEPEEDAVRIDLQTYRIMAPAASPAVTMAKGSNGTTQKRTTQKGATQ